jgi:hypothetical protein
MCCYDGDEAPGGAAKASAKDGSGEPDGKSDEGGEEPAAEGGEEADAEAGDAKPAEGKEEDKPAEGAEGKEEKPEPAE